MLEKLKDFMDGLTQEEFEEITKEIKESGDIVSVEEMKKRIQQQIDQRNIEAYNKSLKEVENAKKNASELRKLYEVIRTMVSYYDKKVKMICPHPKEHVSVETKSVEGGYLNTGYNTYIYTCDMCDQIIKEKEETTGFA